MTPSHRTAGTAALLNLFPLVALAGAALAGAALAGAAQPAPKGSIREPDLLEEVIVTATPLRKSVLQTAQPARVVGEDVLVPQRAISLGETLADIPGLSATSFGPAASRPLIRGQGGLRVQMYQDGGDALDVSALSDDHAVAIDPLLARRIEILKGPAALLFGNSASAGAVNVVTDRIPSREAARPIDGAVELRGDDALGERALAARVGVAAGGGWRLSGDLHRRRTDEVAIPGYALSDALRAELAAAGEAIDDARGVLANSDSSASGASLGISRVGDTGWFGLSVSRFDTRYGLPGPHGHHGHHEGHDDEEAHEEGDKHEDEGGVRLDLGQRRVDAEGEWRPADGLIDAFRLRFSRNDYAHLELEPSGEVGTRYAQLGQELRISAVQREALGWRGTFGMQLRDAEFDAEGEEAFLPPSRTENLGLFVFQERGLGPLTIEAGARYEHQRIRVDESVAPGPYEDESLSASLGALWPLQDRVALALQLDSVERHPTATELHARGPHLAARRYEIGDAALRTERGRIAELSLRLGAAESPWSATLAAFSSRYDRYIVARATGEVEDDLEVVQFAATGARFTGVELEWTHERLAETRAGRVGLRLFADAVRAEDDAGAPLPQIPPLRLGGGLSLAGERLRAALEAIWHDSQTRVAPGERATPGFTLVELDLSYRVPVASGGMLWFVRGSNLLDEDARRHASPLKDYAPLAGRSVSAGVRLEF